MACFLRLWIFFSALAFSNALSRWSERCTDVSIDTSLKSKVSLPCHFNTSLDSDTVTWRHLNNGDTLVKIIADGRIYFDNPREGRVTAFPLLVEEGNFSILIHDLESSDVGVYFCELNSECWRVKITESAKSIPAQENTVTLSSDLNSWLFFLAGACLFAVVFIVFYHIGLHNRLRSWTGFAFRNQDSTEPTITTVYDGIQAKGRS
ncbi:uncharacterized protein [Danio rerio]|uniref:Uncharacterized protein n=2 Tax=Danio rerio TaxID=7955 RepID=A0AC58HCB6_DANRE